MYYDICGGRYLSNKHAEHGCVETTETVACKLHRQIVASVILNKLARKLPSVETSEHEAGLIRKQAQ
jgi:hypothetical protein